MSEYKPIFNAELPWQVVLMLFNELLEHEIESSSSCGEIEYIIIEVNSTTKNILKKLGIDINQIDKEFYNEEEKWLDITSVVWGNIAWHYGKELWYTGKKFIAWTDWERELETAVKEMYSILFATGMSVKIPKSMDITIKEYRQKMENWSRMVKRIEGESDE